MIVEVVKGDITKMDVEAIVNAANTSLLGGGGVDGSIHRVGGKAILEACRGIRNRQGGCKVGEAVITTGGNLKAKQVIHTVGPRWNNNQSKEPQKLKNCYLNSIALAEEHKLKSLAFPNISTGIYRFPKQQAAEIAVAAINAHLPIYLERIIFVCYDDENYQLYQALLD